MGETKVRLPFGGQASTNSDEVRAPQLSFLFCGLAVIVIFLILVMCLF
jgi:hypothetical protein